MSKSAAAIKTQKPTGSLKTKVIYLLKPIFSRLKSNFQLNNGLKVVSQENNGAISQLVSRIRVIKLFAIS